MAIAYPVNLPGTPEPAQVELRALTVGGRSVSPLTLKAQTFEWAGNRWLVAVRYAAMTRTKADALVAALVSLYGVGTFFLGPVGDAKTAKGAATGTPLVNGGSQAGKTLVTDGWTVAVTGILKAGDYIQVGSGATARLYMVLVDANSDAGGNATLDIWPRLRESPADNGAIVVASPKAVFRMAGNGPAWEVGLGNVYTVAFEAEEAI